MNGAKRKNEGDNGCSLFVRSAPLGHRLQTHEFVLHTSSQRISKGHKQLQSLLELSFLEDYYNNTCSAENDTAQTGIRKDEQTLASEAHYNNTEESLEDTTKVKTLYIYFGVFI